MTDKHAAERSKAAYLGVKNLCEMFKIVHTTIKPEVSASSTKLPFLFVQVNFHTSKSF